MRGSSGPALIADHAQDPVVVGAAAQSAPQDAAVAADPFVRNDHQRRGGQALRERRQLPVGDERGEGGCLSGLIARKTRRRSKARRSRQSRQAMSAAAIEVGCSNPARSSAPVPARRTGRSLARSASDQICVQVAQCDVRRPACSHSRQICCWARSIFASIAARRSPPHFARWVAPSICSSLPPSPGVPRSFTRWRCGQAGRRHDRRTVATGVQPPRRLSETSIPSPEYSRGAAGPARRPLAQSGRVTPTNR